MFANYPVQYTWQNITIYSATQLGWNIASKCVIGWSISLDGTDPDAAPIRVDLLRGTGTPGTGTGLANGRNYDPNAPASASLLGSWQTVGSWVEGNLLESHFVHPAGGVLVREYPLPQLHADRILLAGSTSRLGIAIRVASDTTIASMTVTLAEQM